MYICICLVEDTVQGIRELWFTTKNSEKDINVCFKILGLSNQ